jgi:hypothetical protein
MSAPDLARGVRASDDEREHTAQLLQSAAAEGRLSPDEAGERLAAASTATYREELNQLVADLPLARERDFRGRPLRPRLGAWWLWSAARFAFVATLVLSFWGFWGIRLFLWPLGLLALAFLARPWRRRRWRRFGWVATDLRPGRAAGPESRS